MNKLIAFRQEVYDHVFLARRDALFDALEALLSGGTVSSFAYWSQNEHVRRKRPSLYAAVEDGRVDTEAMRALASDQLPQEGGCLFPLDSSSWPRPCGRVLEDLQYVSQASSDVDGGVVATGYPYPCWSGAPSRSGLRIGSVVRLRRDRALYRPAAPVATPRRGRPRKHGSRFAFQDPARRGPPDEVVEFADEQHGRVRLEHWNGLHERRAPALVYAVARTSIHLEQEKPHGWPKGRPKTPKLCYKVVKKDVATAHAA